MFRKDKGSAFFMRSFSVNFVLLLVAMLLLIPLVVYYTSEYIDPFTFSTASLAHLYHESGHITLNPFEGVAIGDYRDQINDLSFRLFSPLVVSILSLVTGITISQLIFLPIDALIIAFVVYALAKRLCNSKLISILLVLFIFSNFPTMSLNINYITLGGAFLFSFILIMTLVPLNDRKTTLVLIMTFVAATLTYYQAEMMILLFTFMPTAIYILNLKFKFAKKTRPPLFYLAFTFLSVFLGLDFIVYRYLEMFSISKGLSFFLDYAQHMVSALFSGGTAGYPSMFVGSPLWDLIRLNAIVNISVTIFPVILYAGLAIIHFLSKKVEKPNETLFIYITASLKKHLHIFLGFIVIGLAWVFVYIPLGSFNIGLLYLLWSIPSIKIVLSIAAYFGKYRNIVLRSFRFVLPCLLALALILSSFLYIYTFVADTQNPYNSRGYGLATSSLNFITSKSNETIVASSSIRLALQSFYEVSLSGKSDQIFIIKLEPSQFKALQNGSRLNTIATMIIIPTSVIDKRIDFDVWGAGILPPAKDFFSSVDKRHDLNKMYDDGNNIVYAVRRALP